MAEIKLCSECKHYLKDDYEPPCRGCITRGENNWEPVHASEVRKVCDTCLHLMKPLGEEPCNTCVSEGIHTGDKYGQWEPTPPERQVAFTNQDMRELLEKLQAEELEVWQGKNDDYADWGSAGNPFANFDEIASKTNLSPEKVLYVYMAKHLRSIEAYIQHGTLESKEPLMGRVIDARNYLGILLGMSKRRGN